MAEPQQVALSTDYFDVRLQPLHGLLELTVRGSWDEDVVRDFVATIQPMVKMDGVTITHSLVDAAELDHLQPLVVEEFLPLIDTDPDRVPSRVAIVLPDMLNRAQSRPVADLVNARFFMTLDLARDWLFSGEA